MVTKSIGQIGCQDFAASGSQLNGFEAARANVPVWSTLPSARVVVAPVNGASTAPTALRPIVMSVIQKPI
jgi:hypothetical protein